MQDDLAVAIVCVVGAVVVACIVSATCLIWRWLGTAGERQSVPDRLASNLPNQVVALEIKVSDRQSIQQVAVGNESFCAYQDSTGFRDSSSNLHHSRRSIHEHTKKRRDTSLVAQLLTRITDYEADSTRNELKSALESITAKALSLRSLNFSRINVKEVFQFENIGDLCREGNAGGIVVIHNEKLRSVSTKNFADSEFPTGNDSTQIQTYLHHIGHEEDIIKLSVSPASQLTLPGNKREIANIPDEATHYCCCYPLSMTAEWPTGVETADPLLDLLHFGGFVYFDKSQQTPKIVAINSFFAKGAPDCKIFLGQCLSMTPASILALETASRWKPVTLWTSEKSTIAHAWIAPNERVGDKQFTRSGGFGYLYSDNQTREREGFFFPVIGSESESTQYSLTDARETVYFEALQPSDDFAAGDDKFSGTTYSMVTGLDLGLSANASVHFLLGISKAALRKIQEQGLTSIKTEWGALADAKEMEQDGQRLRDELEYALGAAKEEEVVGNHGQVVVRDKGHDGFTLERFLEEPKCKNAELILPEVLALRLYTSKAFREVNGPLRNRANPTQKNTKQWKKHPVPLPATTYFISSAVTKLQGLLIAGFQAFDLWRGLANMDDLTPEYMQSGGHELACMSTSKSRLQCCHYARSSQPLILKFRVETHRNVGADISFVSMFPSEEEYLYPPLTHLKPVGEADLVDKDKNVIGRLVTVVPSFPNIDLAEQAEFEAGQMVFIVKEGHQTGDEGTITDVSFGGRIKVDMGDGATKLYLPSELALNDQDHLNPMYSRYESGLGYGKAGI
jgi:hypothetical protein